MQGEVEGVDGLLVGFDVFLASGEVMQIQALKHHGLGRSGTMLRAKVLSVPAEFAAYWNLELQLGTHTDPTNPNNCIYTRQAQRLMLVIGLDLLHYFPTPVANYRDHHGIVQLHNDQFSGRLLATGNRTFPLTSQAVRNIIKRVKSTSDFFGIIQEINEECLEDEEAVTTLMCSLARSAPMVPTHPPVARAVPAPAALHSPDEGWDRGEEEQSEITELTPFLITDNSMSESELQRNRVAENRRYLFTGEVPPALRVRLERFTEGTPQPKHRLHP